MISRQTASALSPLAPPTRLGLGGTLAELRGMTLPALAELTTANVRAALPRLA